MGGLAAVRHWNRSAVRILMYHNFSAESVGEFEKQCRYLNEHCTPVSMTHVQEWLCHKRSMPPNAVAITVDDGYRDFYTNAFPVLKSYQFPCTVYLFTDFLDGITWPWWDQLSYLCEKSPISELKGPDGVLHPLTSPADRAMASENIASALKLLPNQERIGYLAGLPALLGIMLPDSPPETYAPMTWDQARRLSHEGVEFGSHTKTHPILTRIDTAQLREEMEYSGRRVQEELGRSSHFCYPNGRWEDIPENGPELLSELGFSTAVTSVWGLNRRESNPFQLRRFACAPEMPFFYFQEAIAGVHQE